MSIELRGLIAAVAAALLVLGGAFGVAAIVRSTQNESPVAQTVASKPVPAGLLAIGKSDYAQSCASCHGVHGQGVDAPALAGAGLSDAEIVSSVKNGYPGQMPAFGSKYNDHDIQAITAYVHDLK